jgi:hypothetical protein
MTTEHRLTVYLPVETVDLQQLVSDMRDAAARAELAVPGDRLDVVRYEVLASQLEAEAQKLYALGTAETKPPQDFSPEDEGVIAVELCLPFKPGPTLMSQSLKKLRARRVLG